MQYHTQELQAPRNCSVGTFVPRLQCPSCIRHGSLQHQAAQSGHGSRQLQATQSGHSSRQLQALRSSYQEIEQLTPTHETFWMLNPPSGVTAGSVAYPAEVPNDLPPASIQSLNHTAIGVQDLNAMRRFYVEVSSPAAGPPPGVTHVPNSKHRFRLQVLQFCQLARPAFPFDGAWLEAGLLAAASATCSCDVPMSS